MKLTLPPVSKTGTARLTTRQLTAMTPFAVPNDDALFLTRRKELTQEKSERRAKRRGLLAESLPPAPSGTMTKAAARASRQRVSSRLRKGRGRTSAAGDSVAPQGAAKDRADRDAKEDEAIRTRAEDGGAPTQKANGRVAPLSAKELARRKARMRVTISAQRMLRTASSRVQAESRRDKDDMSSFLSKKRQMFLVQMALDVKRREMRKLQDRATDREQRLRHAELVLEEDHVRFETFLKENNDSTSAALQRCEQISQLKRERMVDIKKMVGTVQQIDTKLTKQRAAIADCVEYQIFLSMLTPQPLFSGRAVTKRMRLEHCVALRKELRLIRADADVDESEFGGLALVNRAVGVFRGLVKDRSVDDEDEDESSGRPGTSQSGRPGTAGSMLSLLETPRHAGGFAFVDETPPATREELNAATTRLATIANASHFPLVVPEYFALGNPGTLLAIYANLEERNLFLVQNRQQSEAAIEELEKRRDVRSAGNEAKLTRVLGEVANLEAAHAAARARLARCAPASSSSGGGGPTSAGGGAGMSSAEQRAKQQRLLDVIGTHVRETYSACKFPLDSHPTTTAMCSALEGLLEELTTRVTAVRAAHPQYLIAAEKKVGKERRDRQRVERAAEEAEAAEVRLIRSRARAAKPIPKRTEKPSMFRSFLIQDFDKTKTVVTDAEREAADVARFLT